MGTLVNGIKEIFATEKTTGSNIMLCGNDGTPDGHMTMDNLASVLGIQTVSLQRGTDLDSLRTPNKYTCSDGPTSGTILNKPSNVLYGFLLEVKPCTNDTSNVVQILWADGGRMFSRTYDNGWSNWLTYSYDIPDFYKSYSDLDYLANALGVIQNKNIQQEKDLNNIFDIGFYLIRIDDGNYINKPIGAGNYGALVVFACGNYKLQVWIEDTIGSKMYIRGNWSGGYNNWYVWREIALTAQ